MSWDNKSNVEEPSKDNATMDWVYGKVDTSSLSTVFCAVHGFDGVGKSGFCIDCRTPQEVKEGKKVIVIDLDGGCINTHLVYHNADPNIIVRNPLVKIGKDIDYQATYDRILEVLTVIDKTYKEQNVKALIFDGMDNLLKVCEQLMRKALNKEPTDSIMPMFWGARTKLYNSVLEIIKHINVDRYLITHDKKDEDRDAKGNVINSKWIPDWEKKTADKLEQIFKINKTTQVVNGDTIVKQIAYVEKFKDNILMVGRNFPISEVIHKKDGTTTSKWFGLRIIGHELVIGNK